MLKLIKNIKRIRDFKKAELKETLDPLVNPCRGWFSLYTFSIEEEPDFKKEKNAVKDRESLALILIDIGAYRETSLDEAAFKRMDDILSYYHGKGKDIILRVAYDHEGKGMEREPQAFSQVLFHAEQVAGFVEAHSDKIFIYQGILVGRWGEMHTSRFLSEEKLRELYSIFEKHVSGKVFLAVRKPVQWRMIRIKHDSESRVEAKGLGLFNDGMFGSDSDLGTFDSSCKDVSYWRRAWNRENETSFISRIAKSVPVGGEALFGEGFANYHQAKDYIKELSDQNITYLNRYHDIKLMEYWNNSTFVGKGAFNGHSCLDYIGAHLGYRLIVRDAEAIKNQGGGYTVSVSIENTGFANMYMESLLYAEYAAEDGEKAIRFPKPLTECKAGIMVTFSVDVNDVCPGRICIYAIQAKGNKRIFFANEPVTMDGKLFIGVIK